MNYPDGGTPPSLTFTPVHAHAEQVVHHVASIAFTGADVVGLGLIALAVVAVGAVMVLISKLGR